MKMPDLKLQKEKNTTDSLKDMLSLRSKPNIRGLLLSVKMD